MKLNFINTNKMSKIKFLDDVHMSVNEGALYGITNQLKFLMSFIIDKV